MFVINLRTALILTITCATLLPACALFDNTPPQPVPPVTQPTPQGAALATAQPAIVPTPTAVRLAAATPTASQLTPSTPTAVRVAVPIASAPGPSATPTPIQVNLPIASAPGPSATPTPIQVNLPIASAPGPTTQPGATPAAPYEDRTDPVRMLASYYNAINRKEYQRAYGYWERPQEPLDQFAQGYADTATVLLVVRPPTRTEGAAGSVYANIPTLLVATHIDGSKPTFSGCYVARRSNVPINNGRPEDNPWSIYSAGIAAAPAGADDATLLNQACPASQGPQASAAYENRGDPVGLLASYYNAINRKDYQRAYGYWGTPPSPPDQFAQGYADTAWVLLAVVPPTFIDAGAGNQFASIPTLLFATHTNGSKATFSGCYVMRRANPQIEGAPNDGAWRIERASIAPAGADAMALLAQACSTP
jgi:hypothetical protein